MKLLIYVPQMAAYGGMERHVCSLAIAAAKRGHAVTMITTSNSLGPDLRMELGQERVVLVELARARGSAGTLRKATWLLYHALLFRGTQWDILYTNGQSALARLVWAAATRKTRIIHHHHTSADADEQTTWSPGFKKVLERAPEVVACSRATRDAIAAACHRTDVEFLPYLTRCPVGVETFEVSLIRRPRSPLRFGFMGRLIPEKGIDTICRLSAEPRLSDIEWHVYGEGPAYPPPYFDRFPRVFYHGPYREVKQQEAALLELDALALFSTHNEGMPLSLIEGLSAGLPFIATNRGGTKEVAISSADCCVISEPHDDEMVLKTVRSFADRILEGKTSRRNQRGIYDQYFSPGVVSSAWLDYFDRPRKERANSAASQK